MESKFLECILKYRRNFFYFHWCPQPIEPTSLSVPKLSSTIWKAIRLVTTWGKRDHLKRNVFRSGVKEICVSPLTVTPLDICKAFMSFDVDMGKNPSSHFLVSICHTNKYPLKFCVFCAGKRFMVLLSVLALQIYSVPTSINLRMVLAMILSTQVIYFRSLF